jgi:F-box protein 11
MADLAAFLSYVHADDHDGGITRLHAALQDEVGMQIGDDFRIFLDRTDIGWGDNWRERIETSLDSVTLLIPVITPRFFGSDECRGELERFLKREADLGRNDLVWPIYYVEATPMNEPGADELAVTLASRQYADWRGLRIEPMTSPVARQRLATIAREIRDRAQSSPAPARREPSATGKAHGSTHGHTEPPTRVVNPYGRGDHASIAEAIAAANAGDRILVQPGLYTEPLVIDKPLELVGQGDVSEIVVRVGNANTLAFRTNIGRVSNMTLQQAHGEREWSCVSVTQGRLELEDCDITSLGHPCVAVLDGADPRVRRNRIHDGNGVFVYAQSLGTFEDNEIYNNSGTGIEVTESANPTFRRNIIRSNDESGVLVQKGGLGTFEDNNIVDNGRCGLSVRSGGKPTVRRNRMNRNRHEAIWIYDDGGGIFEDNDLTENGKGAWDIAADAGDIVRHGNKEE